MFLKIEKLLTLGVLLLSVTAYADETDTKTEDLHMTFNRSAAFIGNVEFSFKTKADTTVTVKDLNYTGEHLSFKFAVEVTCKDFDAKGKLGGKEEAIHTAQTVCVSSTEEKSVDVALPPEKSRRLESVSAKVTAAMVNDKGTSPDGINFETPFATIAETLCPGTTDDYKAHITCMAFGDRKVEISNQIAELVIRVTGAAN